jgi:hypothetical protein
VTQARLAVYSPPCGTLLPYLGVVIHEDDAVQAMAFKTEEEAQRFVHDAATKLAAFANEEKPDVDIPDA